MQERKLKMVHNSLSTVSVSTAHRAYLQQGVQAANKLLLSSAFILEALILPQVPSSAVKMDNASRICPVYHKWTFPFHFPFSRSLHPKRKRLRNILYNESLRSLRSITKTELCTSACLWVHNTPKSTSFYAAHHIHYDDSFQQKWISVLL